MQLIPDTIDLRAYTKAPDFEARVRKASDFIAEIQAELAPKGENHARHPTMLSPKAQGRIEFRPGEITCWSGYNGHRKSMFTSQVALDLCMQKQRVLIVSLEMSPTRTMARMTRQATGTGYPHPDETERFARWTDDQLWLFDYVGRLDTKTAIGLCRYFAQKLGGQHVFIDSMMKVCESEESLDEQKQFVTSICELADETGLHLHLVTHCRKPQSGDEGRPPSKYDIKGSGSISDQAHNIMMVWQNKAKKAKLEVNSFDESVLDEPDAIISCEKQRNGEWEGKLKFWFHNPSMRFCDDRGTKVEAYRLPWTDADRPAPARASGGAQ